MHRIVVALLVCCASAAPTTQPAVSYVESVVRLPFGLVRGNVNENAREFLGIPYPDDDLLQIWFAMDFATYRLKEHSC